MDTIRESGLADLSLGIGSPNLQDYPKGKSFGWTIALSDKFRIPVKEIRPSPRSGRIKYLSWGQLTPIQQWNYIKYQYVPELTQGHFTKFLGFPELHKSGNVHCHLVVYSDNPNFDVITFRKLCSQNLKVLSLTHGKNLARLNYIHTLENYDDDDSWIEYITKDHVVT